MNYVGSISQSLKYRRFTPSDCEDIRIKKCEFVAKLKSFLRRGNVVRFKYDLNMCKYLEGGYFSNSKYFRKVLFRKYVSTQRRYNNCKEVGFFFYHRKTNQGENLSLK